MRNRPTSGAYRTQRRRARRGEGRRLRDEILDAAETLLLAKGNVDEVSVRDIAGAVGCSPPAIYMHFPGKEDVFLEVCGRRWEGFAAAVLSALDRGASARERLTALAHEYVRFGVENPAEYRVLFDTRTGDLPGVMEPESPYRQALDLVAGVIESGVETGEFRDVDPGAVALVLRATFHGIVSTIIDGHLPRHGITPEDLVEAALILTFQGLCSP